MDDRLDLKEFEGLLEQAGIRDVREDGAEEDEEKGIKKYLKLVLPHVALVLVVIVYAILGALVFYKVEEPHEDKVKTAGVQEIKRLRELMLASMWNNSRKGYSSLSKDAWLHQSNEHLDNFASKLYTAFKEEFVAYQDVSLDDEDEDSAETTSHSGRAFRRQDRIWTIPSAIFFAATTMATIGYGNIVPVTPQGRIVCLFFALFGAPLAILMIGDIGKFLSEWTIWLYRHLKKGKTLLRTRWRQWRGTWGGGGSSADLAESASASENPEVTSLDELEDMIMDKTQVPVIMVFAILLIYIALGAILFSFMEGWTYVDAFYFCFITLTTVGFGDLVPQKHQYIIVMLLYIGVGLAVTTMCIDLVGIQYIQKIHYFGRKFRGADLLQLLKRKRMIERRLAMAQGENMIQMYMDRAQPPAEPSPHNSSIGVPVSPEWKENRSWELDNVFTYGQETETKEKTFSPSPREPSIATTSPSVRQREFMYGRGRVSIDSRSPSGPDISIPCSIRTSPSVYDRERLYSQMWLRSPSAASFEFEFPYPDLDLAAIAQAAKTSRRIRSCPERFVPPSPPSVSDLPSPPSVTECAVDVASVDLITFDSVPLAPIAPSEAVLMPTNELELAFGFQISLSESSALSAADKNLAEIRQTDENLNFPPPPINTSPTAHELLVEDYPPRTTAYSISASEQLHSELVNKPAPSQLIGYCPSFETPSTLFVNQSAVKSEATNISKPVSAAVVETARISVDKSQTTARTAPGVVGRSFHLPLRQTPSMPTAFPPPPAAPNRLPSPHGTTPIGLSRMEDWDSFKQMIEASRKVRLQLPQLTIDIASPSGENVEDEDVGPPSLLSPMDLESDFPSSALTTPMSSPCESELDFGAFEVICDSGLSAEELVTSEDPLMFHENLPVHSVHHQTVKTDMAIESIMSCPESVLTQELPPAVVSDNYCFVVDGDSVKLGDIMGDDQWWRHTSRPTKYYYSEDLKRFQKVVTLQAKGKVISARFPSAKGPAGSHLTPEKPGSSSSHQSTFHTAQSSSHQSTFHTAQSAATAAATPHKKEEEVPLENVYKVVRFYSFWKSCTAFHRIVTLIAPADEARKNPQFRKRIFVQYLWRNAKEADKKRVSKEFDPRRQRLLRYVTDPASRKKMFQT